MKKFLVIIIIFFSSKVPDSQHNTCPFICLTCKTKLWEYLQFKIMCRESDLIYSKSKNNNLFDDESIDSKKSDDELSSENYESIRFLDEMVDQTSSIVEEAWRDASSGLSGSSTSDDTLQLSPPTVLVLQELTNSPISHDSIPFYGEPKDYDLGIASHDDVNDRQVIAAPEDILFPVPAAKITIVNSDRLENSLVSDANNNITSDGVANSDSSNNKQFTCEQCKKVCHNLHSFKKHLQVHADPQFACQVCGKRYKRPDNLTAHLKSHGQPTLQCDKCNATFKYHASYHYHIKHVQ